jgi:hypothetical protein
MWAWATENPYLFAAIACVAIVCAMALVSNFLANVMRLMSLYRLAALQGKKHDPETDNGMIDNKQEGKV